MALLTKVEIYFVKVHPDFPDKYDPTNPRWALQGRTKDKEVAKEWRNLGLTVKLVEDDETGEQYYRINLSKRTTKADGSKADPVEVVNGKRVPVSDVRSIGNGSIANIRVFVRDYTKPDGTPAKAGVLMGLQLIVHNVYIPKAHDDDFGDEGDTEVVYSDGETSAVVEDDMPY
jgi:hypothetical protein